MERLKLCLYKQGFHGALLLDLSKAFDTINHEILDSTFHGYGFYVEILEVLLDYLQEMWKRVKINTTFSSWTLLLLYKFGIQI